MKGFWRWLFISYWEMPQNKLVYCLLANTQLVGHLPTAISKGGLSYGKSNIATDKYHWIHVRWKIFDGGYSFPTEKLLKKN